MARLLIALLLLCLNSLSASAQPYYVRVISPNGGENWRRQSSHVISWVSNAGGNVAVQLYRHAGDQDDFVAALSGSTPNDGGFGWTIDSSLTPDDNYRIRIATLGEHAASDLSDGDFTVSVPPRMTVIAPNGGENWLLGSVHTITWTDNISGTIQLALIRGGAMESVLVSNAPNIGSFVWHIPLDLAAGTDIKVRAMGVSDSTAVDWSDTVFALSAPPSINLTIPDGGEVWFAGDLAVVRWTSVNMTDDDIRVELKRNYPVSAWVTIAANAQNTGAFVWEVSGPRTTTARIRVTGTVHAAAADTSEAEFAITDFLSAPTLTIHAARDAATLRWNHVADATAFEVWQAAAANGDYNFLATTADTSLSIEISGQQRQFYRVVAIH